ncbi:MAG: O-antigen ligase family protein [Beduini sp.]|uniref:O-antigen ligase family protein n=1 Tax=Beduini sp. TaxID=1922300 RepID=UPI0039A12FA2
MNKLNINKNYTSIIAIVGLMMTIIVPFNVYASYISLTILILLFPFFMYDVIYKKSYKKMKHIKYLLIFILAYIITIFLSEKNNLISTVHVFIWMIIYMIYIYPSNKTIDYKESLIQFYRGNKIIIIITAMIQVIAISFFIFNYGTKVGSTFIGMYYNRNSGITIDSIQLSWISITCIAGSLINYTLIQNKIINAPKNKYFYLGCIVLSLITLETTLTRNTIYSTIALFLFIIFIYTFKKLQNRFKNILAILLLSISITTVSLGIFLITDKVIRKELPNIIIQLPKKDSMKTPSSEINSEQKTNENSEGNTVTTNQPSAESPRENKNTVSLERSKESRFKYGLSGRYEIWRCGINVIKSYPLFGVSTGDMIAKTIETNEGNEFYKVFENSPNVFASQHNAIMHELVASGFVGFILLTLFIFYMAKDTLVYLYKCKFTANFKIVCILASIIATFIFVIGIGQSIFCFQVSFISAYLWYIFQYLEMCIQLKEVEE